MRLVYFADPGPAPGTRAGPPRGGRAGRL